MSSEEIPRRRPRQPSAAFRLLVYLLYGQYPYMYREARGVVKLSSLRKLARLLGTETKYIRRHLSWLEDRGYIESVAYSENRRQVQFRIRQPVY